MTTSNHLFAGAVIALTVKQPLLAVPLALMSHYILDALPHFGYKDAADLASMLRFRLTLIMESVNIIGVPLLIYLLWGNSVWVFLTALVAITPDFVWVYRYYWYDRFGLAVPLGRFSHWHSAIQWGERPWGIVIELATLMLLIGVTTQLVA